MRAASPRPWSASAGEQEGDSRQSQENAKHRKRVAEAEVQGLAPDGGAYGGDRLLLRQGVIAI
jgi:hypothetical protein